MAAIFSPWLIWFILGIAMAFVELMLPGFIIIFFAVGCLVVAVVLLVWPITLSQQILLFILASIFSITFLRKWSMGIFQGIKTNQTEKDYDDFPKGAQAKVVQRISPEVRGRIRFRGTFWEAVSDEMIEKDEIVKIVRFAENSRQIYFVKKP